MEPMAMLTVSALTGNRAYMQGVRSALPDAPVVPESSPSRAVVRTRSAAATALRHLADVVAPSPRTLSTLTTNSQVG